MAAKHIGILHPGAMGVSVAAAAHRGGQAVYWASAGRSAATAARADEHGLTDLGSVAALCQESEVILSVCPPHAAEAVAREVAALGFRGLYLDANAIAPPTIARIGTALAAAGIELVDGGLIGPPAWKRGATMLALSGPRAGEIAALFAGSNVRTEILSAEIGQASALKMCYAAYTKGTTALLCAVLATAEAFNIRPALMRTWSRDDAKFADQSAQRARSATAKAWRFTGEMDEIAATFRSAGLPGEFHAAAGEIYRRLAGFKDAEDLPSLEVVLAALAAGS